MPFAPPPDVADATALATRTRQHLEWDSVLEILAGQCIGEAAQRHLKERVPASSWREASRLMTLTREALEAAAVDEALPHRGAPDVELVIERTRKGGLASGLELRQIADLLEVAHTLRSHAKAHRLRWAALGAAVDSPADLDKLGDKLRHALDSDGAVLDVASTALRQARKAAAEKRREVQRSIQAMLKRYAEVLRDDYYAERDGRYVLPVRSDAHLKVPGIVLGSSASGGTLYVEPQELTGLGNELQIAEAAVEREQARVLADLSRHAQVHAVQLAQAWDGCIAADELGAIVRWAKRSQSSAVKLCLVPKLSLLSVRHPLLAHGAETVIANDVNLEAGAALVLSGPNAGGKTVLLKCVGLVVRMAHAGLPIPADPESEVGWLDTVLTDMGDDQSLPMSLSTFSAHISNLAGIVEQADRGTLALLDEVAAGTDPEEGSALAAAVLERLVEKGAAVLVTTHYERLKELAAGHAAFQNGSVGFDIETLSPTFTLSVGAPGPSTALVVARRFGMPETVVARAKELIPTDSIDREQLVQQLQAERSRLEKAAGEAERELRRQQVLRQELEQERLKVREKERAQLERRSAELVAEVQDARAALRAARARLKTDCLVDADYRQVEKEIDLAARPVALGGRLNQTLRGAQGQLDPQPKVQDLVPGLIVYLTKLGAKGEILEVSDRGQLTVRVGSLKMKATVADVTVTPGQAPAKTTQQQQQKAKARVKAHGRQREASAPPDDAIAAFRTSANTLDLRGQRVEVALEEVDRFIDLLLQRGEPAGFVLHGHGTGALKSAVRAHLSAHPVTSRARAAERDEGGDAFSIFWLGGPGR